MNNTDEMNPKSETITQINNGECASDVSRNAPKTIYNGEVNAFTALYAPKYSPLLFDGAIFEISVLTAGLNMFSAMVRIAVVMSIR